MPTLWEMLTKKKETPVTQEDLFYNPLHAKIGTHVKINTLDLEHLSFMLSKIRVVERHINDQVFKFVDYDIIARPPNLDSQDVIKKRIRLTPLEETDGELTHSILLLNYFDGFAYHKEFHEGLDFEVNNGEFYEDTLDASYWRVNDVEDKWVADTATLEDDNADGFVDEDEVKRDNLEYWDFWRDTIDEGGNPINEFYIVEMNGEDGWFDFWVGKEIDASRIDVLSHRD